VQARSAGRNLIYNYLPYNYYLALSTVGPWSIFEEPARLMDAFEEGAAKMVAEMPQAKLTVKEVVAMFVTKHGANRKNLGAIEKHRIARPPAQPKQPKLDKDGNPKKPPTPVPQMFTRAATIAMK
jgi:hypothetical protein